MLSSKAVAVSLEGLVKKAEDGTLYSRQIIDPTVADLCNTQ